MFNKLFHGKKGIEVWVSWVLLTAMVMVLSLFMYQFMVRYTQTHASETVSIVSDNLACESIGFRVFDICKEDDVDLTGLKFSLENTRELNIDGLLIRFYDNRNDLLNSSEIILYDGVVTFRAGQKKYFDYNLSDEIYEDVFLVQLLPEILLEGRDTDEMTICDLQRVEYKNITLC